MRRVLFSLVLGSSLAFATPLFAQTAAELEAARGLYAQGSELEKSKDYAAAYEKFRKVGEIKSTAIVRYHEGFCAEKLGKWVEALDAYSRSQLDGQGDAKQKDAVDASHKAAEALRARIPKIKVKINGASGKPQVVIDEHSVSTVLLDEGIPVNVGTHTVAISGGGAADDKQEVTVGEKDVKEVVFEAKASGGAAVVVPPPPPPEEKGKGTKPPPEGNGKDAKPASASTYVAPRIGFVFGVSVASIGPGGQLEDSSSPTASYVSTSPDGARSSNAIDFMKTGAAIEGDIGFRFVPALAAYLFWQHGFLGAPDVSTLQASGGVAVSSMTVTTDAFGLGLMLNSNPGGRWGFYGDLATGMRLTKVHVETADHTTEEGTLIGIEPLRLKVGVAFKPSAKFTMVGYLWASAGSYTKIDLSVGGTSSTKTIDSTAIHNFAGLGLGGFFDVPVGN